MINKKKIKIINGGINNRKEQDKKTDKKKTRKGKEERE